MHRRYLVVVVATLAAWLLPGVTGAGAQAPDPRPEFVIIGIGDSYSSGEGNPEVAGAFNAVGGAPDPVEKWIADPEGTLPGPGQTFPGPTQDPNLGSKRPTAAEYRDDYHRCHRSPRSWQQLVANRLQAANQNIRVVFRSFACSGASITGEGGVLKAYSGADPAFDGLAKLRPQLTQINEDFLAGRTGPQKRIDALIMTAGGNDALFSYLVALCLGDNIERSAFTAGSAASAVLPFGAVGLVGVAASAVLASQLKHCHIGEDPVNLNPIPLVIANLGRSTLSERFELLSQSLEAGQHLPSLAVVPARVFLSQVPDPVRDENGRLCDGTQTSDPIYRGLLKGEARFLNRDVVKPLNAAYADGATTAGWTVIDTVPAAGREHGVCADGASFFAKNSDGLRRQGNDVLMPGLELFFSDPISGALAHPNQAGNEAIAGLTLPKLQEQVTDQFIPGRATLILGRVAERRAPRLSPGNGPGQLPEQLPDRVGPRARAAQADTFCPNSLIGSNPGCIELRWTVPAQAADLGFRLEIAETGAAPQVRNLPAGRTSFVHRGSGRFLVRLQSCPTTGCRAFGDSAAVISNTIEVSNLRPGSPTDLRQTGSPTGPLARKTINIRWTPADSNESRFEVEYRRLLDIDDSPGVKDLPAVAVFGPMARTLGGGCRSTIGFPCSRVRGESFSLGSSVPGRGDPVSGAHEFRVRACSDIKCSAFTRTQVFSPGGSEQLGQTTIDDVQRVLEPSREFDLDLSFQHPSRAKLLESIDVRLVGPDGPVGCVRLDQDSGELGVAGGTCPLALRTGIVPGRGKALRRGAITLVPTRSRLTERGDTGKTLGARVNLELSGSLAGQVLRLEVAPRDAEGRRAFRPVGAIAIPAT